MGDILIMLKWFCQRHYGKSKENKSGIWFDSKNFTRTKSVSANVKHLDVLGCMIDFRTAKYLIRYHSKQFKTFQQGMRHPEKTQHILSNVGPHSKEQQTNDLYMSFWKCQSVYFWLWKSTRRNWPSWIEKRKKVIWRKRGGWLLLISLMHTVVCCSRDDGCT